jgi:hypothetical protein
LNGIAIAIDFLSLWKNILDLIMGEENEQVKKLKESSNEVEKNLREVKKILYSINKNEKSQKIIIDNMKELLEKFEIFLEIEKIKLNDDEFDEIKSYLSLKFLVIEKDTLKSYLDQFKRLEEIEVEKNLFERDKKIERELMELNLNSFDVNQILLNVKKNIFETKIVGYDQKEIIEIENEYDEFLKISDNEGDEFNDFNQLIEEFKNINSDHVSKNLIINDE